MVDLPFGFQNELGFFFFCRKKKKKKPHLCCKAPNGYLLYRCSEAFQNSSFSKP